MPLECIITYYITFVTGEESLTVFVEHGNGDLPAENFSRITDSLHQLTAAYFTERDTTLRRLHEMQISSGHIKVRPAPFASPLHIATFT